MAKSRSKPSRSVGRVIQSYNALAPARPRPSLAFTLPPLHLTPVPSIDDRRHFHFDRVARPAVALQRVATRLVSSPRNLNTIRFEQPNLVAICVRRKKRRQVIFARNKSGRNGQRRSRRNPFSSIGC